jgi:hypothetical protein
MLVAHRLSGLGLCPPLPPPPLMPGARGAARNVGHGGAGAAGSDWDVGRYQTDATGRRYAPAGIRVALNRSSRIRGVR